MADEDTVKGGKELAVLAEKGMALFAAQEGKELEGDVEAATAFKTDADAKYAALEAEAAALTGKDNKKARQEKSKEAAAIKTTPEYIDATRVIKGQAPKNGNFVKAGQETAPAAKADAAPAPAAAVEPEEEKAEAKKKAEKKPKKEESAGISKAERDELEKLKTDIITRKKELKETGMSGGQINKDEEVARMVSRMNELKEKENPGALAAAKEEKKPKKKQLSAEMQAEKENLEKEIEEYRLKLKTEFGYSNKEIKADPDLLEMTKRLNEMK